MPHRLTHYLAVTAALAAFSGAQPQTNNAITAVRHWNLGDVTRIVVETTTEFEFRQDRVPDPDRLFFDLDQTKPKLGQRGQVTFRVNDPRLKQIRVAETQPGTSRVVFDLEEGVDHTSSRLSNPPRLIIELRSTTAILAARGVGTSAPTQAATPATGLPPTATQPVERVNAPLPVTNPPRQKEPVPQPEITANAPALPRETPKAPSGLPGEPTHKAAVPPPPQQKEPVPEPELVATAPPIPRATVKVPATVPGQPRKTRQPKLPPPPRAASLKGHSSMARVLGLKLGRIVLDAGHGGHDTGTIGRGGLLEKDLCLDIAQRVGELIENRMGAEVIYTRTDDTFIPLERRPEIANEKKADLYLSIHANSSPAASASGVETYYLNFTTSATAMEVAARENASSQKTMFELKDVLQRIALQDKVEESKEFAARVQQALYTASVRANARTKDRGVRKAPFVVLIGASMPAILAEIGFISNPRDEALLKKSEFRQKIAEGLYQGLSKYAATLSHFEVAQK